MSITEGFARSSLPALAFGFLILPINLSCGGSHQEKVEPDSGSSPEVEQHGSTASQASRGNQVPADRALLALLSHLQNTEWKAKRIILRRQMEDIERRLRNRLLTREEDATWETITLRLTEQMSCNSSLSRSLLAGPSIAISPLNALILELGEGWLEYQDVDSHGRADEFWTQFREIYSADAQLVTVGQIVMSSAQDEALVVITRQRGPTSGNSALFYLRLEPNGWALASDLLLWIS